MTSTQFTDTTNYTPLTFRWTRRDIADARAAFRDTDELQISQRQFAREHDIPPSTLRQWLDDDDCQGLEPDFIDFFKSPTGELFLRQLVLTLHLLFNLSGLSGLRVLGHFLRRTNLDRFVAASYGAQQSLAHWVQEQLAAYATQQAAELAAAMQPKTITVCGDEHFHESLMCLVAIEPVSNFILLEGYRSHRDAETWTQALKDATTGMPVEIIQLTSDQAKGLLACAQNGLSAHHSPDLFHDQQELTRATALPLQRQIQEAQQKQAEFRQRASEWQEEQEQYLKGPRPPGHPPHFEEHIAQMQRLEAYWAGEVKEREGRRDEAREAVRGLGDDYHPFDAVTGRPLESSEVEQRLGERMAALAAVVAEASLGEKAEAAVKRVGRWLVPLVATIAWFWTRARQAVACLHLPEEAETMVMERLLPGLYWSAAAQKGRDVGQRRAYGELSERLLKEAWGAGSPLLSLSEADQARVRAVGSWVSGLFQRSSSCVEGRNGRLSLQHHGQGALSAGRLLALTTVHNYLSAEVDGPTAAERFFGKKPADLFEWLLARLPDLPRPRRGAKKQTPSVN